MAPSTNLLRPAVKNGTFSRMTRATLVNHPATEVRGSGKDPTSLPTVPKKRLTLFLHILHLASPQDKRSTPALPANKAVSWAKATYTHPKVHTFLPPRGLPSERVAKGLGERQKRLSNHFKPVFQHPIPSSPETPHKFAFYSQGRSFW